MSILIYTGFLLLCSFAPLWVLSDIFPSVGWCANTIHEKSQCSPSYVYYVAATFCYLATFVVFFVEKYIRRITRKKHIGDRSTFAALAKDFILIDSVSLNLITLEYTLLHCQILSVLVLSIQMAISFAWSETWFVPAIDTPFHWSYWLLPIPISIFFIIDLRVRYEEKARKIRLGNEATLFFASNKKKPSED